MSRLVLERELHLIRERLEAIEDALGEEMTGDDKQALDEAMKEHREGKTIAFRPTRSKREAILRLTQEDARRRRISKSTLHYLRKKANSTNPFTVYSKVRSKLK